MGGTGSSDFVLVTVAILDDGLVEHVGNNSAGNALSLITLNTIVRHRASLDVAVGDFTAGSETGSDSTRTAVNLFVVDGHILHAETGHRTRDNGEETGKDWSFDMTIADDVSTAVVVTLEALHARGQRGELLIVHVDVGHLLDVYLAVAGGVDVFVNRQQVVHVGYLERSVLRASSIQRQYLVGQDGHREVQSVEAVGVVSHKLDGHLVAGTHHHADVRLLAIDLAEENGVAFLVGQLGVLRIIAVIDHHVVARLAVAAHRLGSDGTAQQNEMLARSTQRQLALIVVAVGRVVASLVVNLVIYGIRIERHNAALAVVVVLRRHLQAPYGIERHGLLGCHFAVGGIEVALAVRLCVPAYKLVVQAALALGIRSQLEGRHEEAVVGLEHLVVGAGDAVMVGVERQPCAVRHIVGVGEHGLIVERMEEY